MLKNVSKLVHSETYKLSDLKELANYRNLPVEIRVIH